MKDTGDVRLDWRRWYRKAIERSVNQLFGAERWICTYANRIYTDPLCSQAFPLIDNNPTKRVYRVVVVTCTCYHPLFLFNQDGDLEQALLRKGNVHSADDWRSVLGLVVERYKDVDIPKFFRGDAAFAQPGVYVYLEAEHYQYAIRMPENNLLREHVRHLLTRDLPPEI